jgi:putative transposase
MVKAYSMDLRERVVAAVNRDGLSRQEAARRFGVAASTSISWVKQLDETGSLAAGQSGGHRPKKIAGEHHDWLLLRCRECAFTIRGLVLELAERGLSVSYRTVWDFVHAERLSYKKNCSRRRAGPSGRGPQAVAVEKISGNG